MCNVCKRIWCLLMAGVMLFGVLLIPTAAETGETVLSTETMTLQLDPQTGEVSGLLLNGQDAFVDVVSGFRVTDDATDEVHVFRAPVSSGVTLSQQGAVGESGLALKVTYRTKGNAIVVEGELQDTTGEDRLLRLEYLLPVKNDELYWYNDTEDRSKVKENGTYAVTVDKFLAGHKMSLYPYGTVSNGRYAAAIGVPMDPPLASCISYKAADGLQNLSLRIDCALTSQTTKSPSKMSFSFVVYAPSEPEWGFRSASQEYYNLFPESFEDKAEGGNWLFQHAYEDLDGVEDFYFKHNETPADYAADQENGIYSYHYTGPNNLIVEWPGASRDDEPTGEEYRAKLIELTQKPAGIKDINYPAWDVRDVAQAVLNSAAYRTDGTPHATDWYVYGSHANMVVSCLPDIPGLNSYQIILDRVQRAEKSAQDVGASLKGVYIDCLSGMGFNNYRAEHFAYADLPLLWDENDQLYLPMYSAMYSYTKAVRQRCEENDQLVFANLVFPQNGSAQYISLVDVPGCEIGPSWGWDPYLQRLHRTLSYQKPWMLLLGHEQNAISTSASSCSYEIKEDIMKSSVAYGLFANVIGYRVDMKEYEKSRPLFRKYTPIVVLEDQLGWYPVTYAAAAGEGDADCERFGDLSTGPAIFTAYNTGETEMDFCGQVMVDTAALRINADRTDALIAYDLIDNRIVPLTKSETGLSYAVSLEPKDVSAVIIGTRDEIWALLYERIRSIIRRGTETMDALPEKLDDILDEVPAGWEEMIPHMEIIGTFENKDAATALAQARTLVAELETVVPLAQAAHDQMLNYQDTLRIQVVDIYNDAHAVISGFIAGSTDSGAASGVDRDTLIIVICAAVVVLVAVAGGIVGFRLLRKRS